MVRLVCTCAACPKGLKDLAEMQVPVIGLWRCPRMSTTNVCHYRRLSKRSLCGTSRMWVSYCESASALNMPTRTHKQAHEVLHVR